MSKTQAYQEEAGGTFSSDGNVYDLNHIFRDAHHVPVRSVPLNQIDWVLKHVKDVDQKRVDNADVTAPILVTPYGEQGLLLVVDGFHRLTKAKKEGLKQLPSKMVSAAVMERALLNQKVKPNWSRW